MKISMNKQSFGMAMESSFSDEVKEYISAARTYSTDKYWSDTVEGVKNAQKNNKKYNIATAIENNTLAAKVIRIKDEKVVRVFKQARRGNAADTLKSASVNATCRDFLSKLLQMKFHK